MQKSWGWKEKWCETFDALRPIVVFFRWKDASIIHIGKKNLNDTFFEEHYNSSNKKDAFKILPDVNEQKAHSRQCRKDEDRKKNDARSLMRYVQL